MTKKLLASFVLTIVFAMQVYAQGKTVSGKVADKKGEAIPGANIVVKGNTAIATVSSDNGTYSLANVPDNATIIITASTFADIEIVVGTESVINVTMNEDETLKVVEVVGALQIKRNKDSMGPGVSVIDNELLTQGKSFSAAQGLSGKIAGVQINTTGSGVNSQARIVLRGNRSIAGNNQALIVIDGFISTQNAYNLMSPSDIENTTVLKGQGAAALYGSEAANGVLMVTTKKGSAGATRVNFSTTQQFDQVSYLPKFQNQFGPGTQVYGTREYQGGENQSYGPAFDGTIRNLGSISSDITPRQLEDGTFPTILYSARPNEKRDVWSTGSRLQNDVSISGGNANTQFYLSGNDLVEKGIVEGDKFRRTGVLFKASTQTEKLSAGFNLMYNTSLQEQGLGDFYGDILQTPAHIPLTSYRNWQDFKNPDGTLNLGNPNNYFNEYAANPWFTLGNSRSSARRNNIQGGLNVNYKLTDWLALDYAAGATSTNQFSKANTGKFTYRAFRKARTIYNPDIPGAVSDASTYTTRLVQDAKIILKNKIMPGLKSTFIIGSQIIDNAAQSVNVGSGAIVTEGTNNVSNRIGELNGSGAITQSRTVGAYADLSLDYKGYLFLHASGRNDWNSLLDRENRSFFYPAVEVSFVPSKALAVLKNSDVLTFLKISGSASKVGSVNVPAYATQLTFPTAPSFPYGNIAGSTVSNQVVRPGLKPEFTTSYELGLEIGFYDRINLQVETYTRETVNQTLGATVSPSSGFTNLLTNVGKTSAKAVEVTLGGDVIKPKANDGFRWNVAANYTYQQQEVVELFGDTKEILLSNNGDFTDSNGGIFAAVGQQYPILKVSNYLRDPQGRVVIDPTTGYPSQAPELLNIGQTNPIHSLGLNTTFSYKGISLFALAEYRAGNFVYNDIGWDLVTTGTGAVTATYNRERFVFPNSSYQSSTDATGNPVYTANTVFNVQDGSREFWDDHYKKYGENFATSAAFWKLKEARLAYTFSPSTLEGISKYIKGASISFVGRNLLLFVPATNQFTDPEFGTNTGNAVGVNSTLNSPPTRTYGFNLNVTL